MSRHFGRLIPQIMRVGQARGISYAIRYSNLDAKDAEVLTRSVQDRDLIPVDLSRSHKVSSNLVLPTANREYYKENYRGSISVDLRGNKLGSKAVAIAEGVLANKAVKKIDIAGNEISDIESLCGALARNSSLLYLSLADNALDDKSIPHLGRMVEGNVILSELNIDGNRITDEGYKELLGYFKRNTSLKHNSNYKLEAADRAELEEIISRNSKIVEALGDYTCILQARLFLAIDRAHHFGVSNPDRKFILPEEVLKDLQDGLRLDLRQKLFADKSQQDVLDLLAQWERREDKIRKIRIGSKVEWPSIFATGAESIDLPEDIVKAKGWKIVARRSADALAKEGKDMKHCVGGHVFPCYNETAHILSVVDQDGKSISTIMLTLDYLRHSVISVKHAAFQDSDPTDQCNAALKWLLDGIREKTIPVDYRLLEESLRQRTHPKETVRGVAAKAVGFDPFQARAIDKAKDAFVKEDLTPEQLVGDLKEFSLAAELDIGRYGLVIEGRSKFSLEQTRDERVANTCVRAVSDIMNKTFGEDVVKVSVVKFDERSKRAAIRIVAKDFNIPVFAELQNVAGLQGKIEEDRSTIPSCGVIISDMKFSEIKDAFVEAYATKKKPNTDVAAKGEAPLLGSSVDVSKGK